jgi:hypothetical protein
MGSINPLTGFIGYSEHHFQLAGLGIAILPAIGHHNVDLSDRMYFLAFPKILITQYTNLIRRSALILRRYNRTIGLCEIPYAGTPDNGNHNADCFTGKKP